jgi:Protein of unknown function (DUF3313)
MTVYRWSRIVALLALLGLASFAAGQTPESPDGLVKITPRRMELAWLRPGADFRPYTKVIIDPTQVAFQPNWLRDYNINADLGSKISQAQANQIMAAAQTNFDEIFRDAFRKAGYEVVTAPGPDVLRVNSAILDLDVNAPAGQSAFQTTWIITAGQAALIVEVRDSATNALLGRVADRRETQNLGRQIASNATNLYDFRLLFTHWAGICTTALAELKAASPIPKDLKPNQRL